MDRCCLYLKIAINPPTPTPTSGIKQIQWFQWPTQTSKRRPLSAKAWGRILISYFMWQKQGKQMRAFDLQVKLNRLTVWCLWGFELVLPDEEILPHIWPQWHPLTPHNSWVWLFYFSWHGAEYNGRSCSAWVESPLFFPPAFSAWFSSGSCFHLESSAHHEHQVVAWNEDSNCAPCVSSR